MNVSYSISDIASRVIFTEIVPNNQLEKYNGTKSIVDNGAIFMAPMLATFIYGVVGIEIVLAIILTLYGIAAIGIRRLRYQTLVSNNKKLANILSEIKEGFQFVKIQKAILAFFILAMTLNFFVASTEEIINPGILITKYQIPRHYFGFSSTFNIIGVILAGIFIMRNHKMNYQKNLNKLFVANSLVMITIGALSLLLYGFPKYIYYGLFLLLQILLGFFTIIINVPLTSYFQAKVPVDYQGRFFAFFSFAANLSIPFGISYSGFVASHLGADMTYIFNNICVIIIVVITYRIFDVIGSKRKTGK